MTAARTTHTTSFFNPAAGSMVLFQDGTTPRRLNLGRRRRRDALLARLMRTSLDRRLAAGEESHSSRLLAVRATQLLTDRFRTRLADRWGQLAVEARRRAAQGKRRGIPSGPSGAETANLLDAVAATLRSDRLVLAQGVAAAVSTLGIAANHLGPLHNGGNDVVAAAARAALAAMDPSAYSASSAARPA